MIEIKNLKKLWEDDGSSVLEGINLTIEDGDIYALVGRSGAGLTISSLLNTCP